MAWSIVVQVLRITQAYFLGLGLGLTVPYSYYLLFMPLGLLMLLLPISISGFGAPPGVLSSGCCDRWGFPTLSHSPYRR